MKDCPHCNGRGKIPLPKPTEGPWKIGYREDIEDGHMSPKADGCYVSIDAPGWGGLASVVVRMEDDDKDREDGIANAHLLAASWDLQHALSDMIGVATLCDWGHSSASKLRQDSFRAGMSALAKSWGEK